MKKLTDSSYIKTSKCQKKILKCFYVLKIALFQAALIFQTSFQIYKIHIQSLCIFTRRYTKA